MIGNETDAQDISSEAFVKLWKVKEDFKTLGNIKAFLYTTTRNTCIDYLRTRKTLLGTQKVFHYLNGMGDQESIENAQTEAELFGELHRQIEKLPPRCKDVFRLLYFHNIKASEVAKMLGITTRNVHAQKRIAIIFLRSHLILKKLLPVS
jgi:RNA polymerase sigma-70 factor (ECF subfamily)